MPRREVLILKREITHCPNCTRPPMGFYLCPVNGLKARSVTEFNELCAMEFEKCARIVSWNLLNKKAGLLEAWISGVKGEDGGVLTEKRNL